jgi:hypothetical protein
VHWHSIHVYYHDTEMDDLILHGVRPLFRRLNGQVSAMYYVRHWRFGPHLRLNIRTDIETFTETVRPAVDEIVGGYLAKYPSTRLLDPAQEFPIHQRLAELEGEQGPLLPWRPNNTIDVADNDSRENILGNRETADLLADFHTATTELAFGMTEESSGAERLAIAFNLMIATAHTMFGDGDITNGFASFRSHAEGFLCAFREGEGLRPGWQEHYQRNAKSLMDRVAAVVTTIDTAEPIAPFVLEWVDSLAPFRKRGRRLAEDDLLFKTPDTFGANSDLETVNANKNQLMQASPYHRAALSDPRTVELSNTPVFMVYRLMLNLTYLHLTKLGIAPAERFLLCHLAANAVEELYGISAFEPADALPVSTA